MTTNLQATSPALIPFLLKFAEPIVNNFPQQLRYDTIRQITQVQVNGHWVDTPDALEHTMQSTRMTKVQAETTDDE